MDNRLMATAPPAQVCAEVNATIAAGRAESARLAAEDSPWPGFTAQCSYACRRGCDHLMGDE